jgi:hypothetical protein
VIGSILGLSPFLLTISWQSHFSRCIVSSLPRLQSDHNPIMLFSHSPSQKKYFRIRFEKNWLSQEGFLELFESWWSNFIIIFDIANQWRLKLQFIRKKPRCYDSNLKAVKRKNKKEYSFSIEQFELI